MSFLKEKSKWIRNSIIGTFISVPIFSSFISTVHLIDLFSLGNASWIAILLSLTFELGSIASFLVLTILGKVKRSLVWFIFFVLSFMQIIGNVYYSFDYINKNIQSNPALLKSFIELFSFFLGDDTQTIKVFLSCLIGIPIPLISLSFLKSLIDYIKEDDVVEIKTETQKEALPETENINSTINTEEKIDTGELKSELTNEDLLIPEDDYFDENRLINQVQENNITNEDIKLNETNAAVIQANQVL